MMIHARITPAFDAAGDPRRRDARVDASADVALRPLGSTSVDAQLINISSLRVMAETEAAIEPGCRGWLSLPGLDRSNALVVWARNGRLGGEFAEPIDALLVLQAIGQNLTTGG